MLSFIFRFSQAQSEFTFYLYFEKYSKFVFFRFLSTSSNFITFFNSDYLIEVSIFFCSKLNPDVMNSSYTLKVNWDYSKSWYLFWNLFQNIEALKCHLRISWSWVCLDSSFKIFCELRMTIFTTILIMINRI